MYSLLDTQGNVLASFKSLGEMHHYVDSKVKTSELRLGQFTTRETPHETKQQITQEGLSADEAEIGRILYQKNHRTKKRQE